MTGQSPTSLFRGVDCLQIPVPDLEAGLAFYRDRLGHELIWRTATAAGLRMPHTDVELVIQTERPELESNLLVTSADAATARFARAGGRVLVGPFDIPIGRCAVVADPWGNRLVFLDQTNGLLVTDANGVVQTNPDGAVRVQREPNARDPATQPSTVIYLNGVSNAGKSTLARAFVAAMEEPHCLVSMDTFEGMAQRRFPLPGAEQFYDECLVPLIHHAAAAFAHAGLGVVVDTVVTNSAWLRDAARQLARHRVLLVGVRCDTEELRRRERERGNRRIGVAEAHLKYVHAAVESQVRYDFEVDTTHTSAGECAGLIKRRLTEGPEPQAFKRLCSDVGTPLPVA